MVFSYRGSLNKLVHSMALRMDLNMIKFYLEGKNLNSGYLWKNVNGTFYYLNKLGTDNMWYYASDPNSLSFTSLEEIDFPEAFKYMISRTKFKDNQQFVKRELKEFLDSLK